MRKTLLLGCLVLLISSVLVSEMVTGNIRHFVDSLGDMYYDDTLVDVYYVDQIMKSVADRELTMYMVDEATNLPMLSTSRKSYYRNGKAITDKTVRFEYNDDIYQLHFENKTLIGYEVLSFSNDSASVISEEYSTDKAKLLELLELYRVEAPLAIQRYTEWKKR